MGWYSIPLMVTGFWMFAAPIVSFEQRRHLYTLIRTNTSAIVVDINVLPALCWRAV